MVLPSNKQKRSMNVSPIMAAFIFVAGIALGHIQAQLSIDTQDYLFSPCPVCHPNSDSQTAMTRNEGWHSIDVFYGKSDHLEKMLPQSTEWFSQARQDEVVSTLLRGKRNGYFVDLAANDATILSNTYSLEKKFDWNGLCIEPNPIYWANLTYRDCQVVAAIVGSTRLEEVDFRFNAGDHGGIIGFDNGKHLKKQSDPKYTVTLTEILERFNAPNEIDYLSLDVEGAEEFIMKNFPLDKYKISLMTVERPKDSLRDLLQAHGFKNIKRLSRWGETLWAHESVMNSLYLDTLDEFTPTKEPKPAPP
mmetsp:Transcript_3847/g.5590  ORF Transcript_3847/g.5590 Transcript_3847/m.5590 type:complete len:305 (+) Transcript_3847:96-1010(+)